MESFLSEDQVKIMEQNRLLAQEKRRNAQNMKEIRSCLSELVAKVCLNETREAGKDKEELFAQIGQREIVKRREAAQCSLEMDDLCDWIACAALEQIEAIELVIFVEYSLNSISIGRHLIYGFPRLNLRPQLKSNPNFIPRIVSR
jgi:hypothetical protein